MSLSFLLLLLFIFVGFRHEVGCDWSGYAGHFEMARFWSLADSFERGSEVGYWALLTLLHAYNLDYPYLNLVMAIPFFWGLFALAQRQPDPLAFLILSFPILIINMPMSAIRQAAGIGFVCLALVAFLDRKLIRYVVFVLLGSLFHASAIVFLALAPFTKLRLSRASAALSLVLVLPGAYFMFADTVEFYTDRYVGTGIDARGAIFRAGMLAIVGAYFLVSLQKRYAQRFAMADYQLALIGSWIMVATLLLVPISTVISDRFGYYVTPIQLMIMARLPYLMPRGSQNQLIAAAPHLGLGVVLLFWTQNSNHFNQCYVPYQNWLN